MTISDSQIRLALRRVEDAGRKKSSALKKQSDATAKAAKLRAEAQRTNSESIKKSKLSQANREEQTALNAQRDHLRHEGEYNRYSMELERLRIKRQQESEKRQQESDKRQRESDKRQSQVLEELKRKNQELQRQFVVPDLVPIPIGELIQHPAKQYDFFISHASEDKDDIARPLKDALERLGATVWFDELNIKIGQSIRREIEKGLSNCRFGVVILSEHFFRKNWTQMELDALFAKKVESGRDLVLPIWHKVTKDQVNEASPFLAGVLALNSSVMTAEEMASELHKLIE